MMNSPWKDFFLQASRYAGFDQTVLLQLIDGLALEPHLFKQIQMLSSGTRRKVWIAAAFASGAALTLLDDPLAALDKSSALLCYLRWQPWRRMGSAHWWWGTIRHQRMCRWRQG
jgi:ABC-type cobalamin/Fe3+-siderophores transport system ATPase subunit